MKKITVVLLLIIMISYAYGTAFKMPKGEGHYEYVDTLRVNKEVSFPIVTKELALIMMKDHKGENYGEIFESDQKKGKLVMNLMVPIKVGLTKFALKYKITVLFNENRIKFIYDFSKYLDNSYYPNKKEIKRALESLENIRNVILQKLESPINNEIKDEFDF